MKRENGEYGYDRPRSQPLTNLPLFISPSVPVETSESAARQIRSKVTELHHTILGTLQGHGAMTCEELCDFLEISGNTMRPRLWELMNLLRIERTTEKRLTHSGRWAYCYRIKDHAH